MHQKSIPQLIRNFEILSALPEFLVSVLNFFESAPPCYVRSISEFLEPPLFSKILQPKVGKVKASLEKEFEKESEINTLEKFGVLIASNPENH